MEFSKRLAGCLFVVANKEDISVLCLHAVALALSLSYRRHVACLQTIKTCVICLPGWHIAIGHFHWGLDTSVNLCCLIQDVHNISFPLTSLPCLAAWLIFFWPLLYSSQPATPPKLWARQAVHTLCSNSAESCQGTIVRVGHCKKKRGKKGFQSTVVPFLQCVWKGLNKVGGHWQFLGVTLPSLLFKHWGLAFCPPKIC